MSKYRKVRNIESYSVQQYKNDRLRQDATIVACAIITFGVIIWVAIR